MTSIPLVFIVALFGLIGSGIWIGLSLLGTGWIALSVFRDMPLFKLLGQLAWNSSTTAELVALPLFILMAEILFRTKISEQMFDGLAPLASRLPGRLLHINILGCTLFAAVSGSSAATAATVGKITYPQLVQRGYSEDAAMGSLAGAGTLGFLIPPSIVLIVYGVLAETSILRLFFAGVIPGVLLALAFMTWIAIQSRLRPITPQDDMPRAPWGAAFRSLYQLLPVGALIVALIGSMYTGIATPNEAAAVGVIGALLIAAFQRCLTTAGLAAAFLAAVRTSSMIGLILIAAAFLSTAVSFLGVAREVAQWVASLGLGPLPLILMLLVIYLILGCFLDGISMIVMTLPIALPLVTAAGYDAIWFGVFLVIAVELAQVTPPVGINLFVIQGMSGKSLGRVALASFPYFIIMALFAIALAIWPRVVTWLPSIM